MLRSILGVIVGFFGWLIMWFAYEMVLSSVWPAFGAHQKAFGEAIKNGGAFNAETSMLIAHIFIALLACIVAGALAVRIAAGNRKAALILGVLLLGVGVMKAAMSWTYVPIWYHIIFTAILLPATIIGGRLKFVITNPKI